MSAIDTSAVSTVVLDLGGVLIDWQPEPAIARGVGHEEAQAFLAAFDFRAWNHTQDLGRPFEETEAAAIAAHPQWREHVLAYREHFAESLVGDFPETVAIVRELHAQGTPMLALTNWAAETFDHARERFEWLALFDEVVVSGEVQMAKPDPAIFALVVERAGVPAGEVFFTDDTPGHVEAARRCGLDAEVFTTPTRLRADLVRRGVLSR